MTLYVTAAVFSVFLASAGGLQCYVMPVFPAPEAPQPCPQWRSQPKQNQSTEPVQCVEQPSAAVSIELRELSSRLTGHKPFPVSCHQSVDMNVWEAASLDSDDDDDVSLDGRVSPVQLTRPSTSVNVPAAAPTFHGHSTSESSFRLYCELVKTNFLAIGPPK